MIIDAVLLGIIQGATEFLPVSSSAHIVILETLLNQPTGNLLLGIILHLGTLCAVCFLFYEDLLKMIKNLIGLAWSLGKNESLRKDPHTRLIGLILISTVITGMIGLSFKAYVMQVFQSTTIIACLMIVNGFILFSNRFTKNWTTSKQQNNKLTVLGAKEIASISNWHAVGIGLAQSFAILPGISRAGTTITAGVRLGVDREIAGRFSFLISVPTILGSFLLELKDISTIDHSHILPLCIGGIASFIVGFYSLKILVRLISSGNLTMFSGYCWGMGVMLLFYSLI